MGVTLISVTQSRTSALNAALRLGFPCYPALTTKPTSSVRSGFVERWSRAERCATTHCWWRPLSTWPDPAYAIRLGVVSAACDGPAQRVRSFRADYSVWRQAVRLLEGNDCLLRVLTECSIGTAGVVTGSRKSTLELGDELGIGAYGEVALAVAFTALELHALGKREGRDVLARRGRRRRGGCRRGRRRHRVGLRGRRRRDDRGLRRRCHRRLRAIAEEKDCRRGGEPDQQQKHECGDGPPPLDGRAAGLGGGDRESLRRTHGEAVPFGVARRCALFLTNRRSASLLSELSRVLAPVLVGDVAEPVVERLPVWLLPDRALPPATTRLMHVE